jgi:hypothetical protein
MCDFDLTASFLRRPAFGNGSSRDRLGVLHNRFHVDKGADQTDEWKGGHHGIPNGGVATFRIPTKWSFLAKFQTREMVMALCDFDP